jgi:hypothetical protein
MGAPGAAPAAAPGAAPAEAGGAPPPGATAKDGINIKHTGDYDKALAIFEANLKGNPKDSLALWGKAWIQAEKGVTKSDAALKDGAKGTFNAFLGVSKDSDKTKEARAALKRLGK